MEEKQNGRMSVKVRSLDRKPTYGWALAAVTLLCLVHSAMAAEGTVSFEYERPVPAPVIIVEDRIVETEKTKTTKAKSAAPSVPQWAKDATADVCRGIAENRREMLDARRISPGAFAATCYYDLLAMAKKESDYDCSRIGDQGRSYGCFQIQTKLHDVEEKDAINYAWAAHWTMDRMVKDSVYPVYRTAALRRHNGSGDAAVRYAESVKAISNSFEEAKL